MINPFVAIHKTPKTKRFDDDDDDDNEEKLFRSRVDHVVTPLSRLANSSNQQATCACDRSSTRARGGSSIFGRVRFVTDESPGRIAEVDFSGNVLAPVFRLNCFAGRERVGEVDLILQFRRVTFCRRVLLDLLFGFSGQFVQAHM